MPPSSSSSPSSRSTSTALATPPDIDMDSHDRATPVITLDADEISHAMAARLTIALLGQMLYMKGQVPFPVASLGRMGPRAVDEKVSRVAQRAAKMRAKFLQSYDDLTSHLHTTFVALSTALALNKAEHPLVPAGIPPTTVKQSSASTGFARARRRPAKIHVLLILGPSPSAPKTRMLLELDGLQVEHFGEREYRSRGDVEAGGAPSGEESGGESSEDNAEAVTATRSRCVPSSPPRTPPPRASFESHSPVLFPVRCHTSPPLMPSSPEYPSSEFSPSSSSEEEESPDEEFPEFLARCTEQANPLASAQRAEEAALRAGERLLSRALFAGGEGLGFGDEIAPTQAHILIHAPRRLAHPTWVPRQSLGNMLDRHVQRFLDSESASNSKGKARGKRGGGFGAGVRTVGVRIRCREDGCERAENDPCGAMRGDDGDEDERDNEDQDQDQDQDEDGRDEMIWWSWDGKLVGFSD